jgi:hypothetical protein
LISSKAYIDTTILTDALLKQDSQGDTARNAFKNYSETILPVYAIKEFQAGPLQYHIWLHDKLALTKSLKMTPLDAVNAIIGYQKNRAKTSLHALTSLLAAGTSRAMTDEELADLFRMATAGLIIRAWNKRRRLTSSVTDELSCYPETDPKIVMRTGLFAKSRKIYRLYGTEECCMANSLKKRGNDLELLMHALDGLTRREDTNRRGVLRKLWRTPKQPMDARDCVKLGDAFFALHAPADSVILTTNVKDHMHLANALGKQAVSP